MSGPVAQWWRDEGGGSLGGEDVGCEGGGSEGLMEEDLTVE